MALVEGLSAEDCMVQSMADANPVKWHLAHVSWFFETLVLERAFGMAGRRMLPFDPAFRVLFNSYYVGVGDLHGARQPTLPCLRADSHPFAGSTARVTQRSYGSSIVG
jgi:hypothetical protein